MIHGSGPIPIGYTITLDAMRRLAEYHDQVSALARQLGIPQDVLQRTVENVERLAQSSPTWGTLDEAMRYINTQGAEIRRRLVYHTGTGGC